MTEERTYPVDVSIVIPVYNEEESAELLCTRLHEALSCLVSNAVKYTEKGGAVRIGVRCSEDEGLVFEIADNGIGISAGDLPRIMEPFEQVDAKLDRRFEGLGLGIPLARALVRMHGGELRYESELGVGTTARLILPFDRVTTSTRAPAPIA